MIDKLSHPWPWYIAGPLIGLMVPILLLLGNRSFGVSATLRHICAALLPGNIRFFSYDWKKEAWNLFFVLGIIIGAIIAANLLANPNPVSIHPDLQSELAYYGIKPGHALIPTEVMNWNSVFTLKGFILLVVGGFCIGFGTRYAGGCTSGHCIMGLSTLQWPSMVATFCFMIGGFMIANFVLPAILSL